MVDRLTFRPSRKSAKNRTNPEASMCFDPLVVDEQAIIPIDDSDEDTGDFVIDLSALVMEEDGVEVDDAGSFDPQSALVLSEPIAPLATLPEVATLSEAMGGGAENDRVENALYRVVLEDMRLDYDVPIAKVYQAIKEKKKSEEASC
ncbi:hypothetical protein AMTRI_Chr02g211700 [Amborella trichopoda]